MSIRRGFFRLWIVASVLWFAGWATFYSSHVVLPSVASRVYVLPSATADFYELDNIFSQFDEKIRNSHWTTDFPNSVRLLVHNDVTKAAFEARAKDFYETYSRPRDTEVTSVRLVALKNLVLVGILPPCILLAIGWALAWSLAGFKADKRS
jgi:hypothetical protein